MLRIVIFSAFLATFASAGELPWIGVSLASPKVEDRSGLDIAEGVSLKVKRVVSGSPLAKAGGQAGDLWWKFDDQILVNHRQMLVLLRAKSPGDQVKIEYFRDRELKSLSLILVSRDLQQVYSVGMRKSGADHSRILAKREQVARVTTKNQEISLKEEGEGWRFKVVEAGTTILSSLVKNDDLSEKVPSKWHGSFLILKLTLEQQGSQSDEVSKPRVRYVPREKSSEE